MRAQLKAIVATILTVITLTANANLPNNIENAVKSVAQQHATLNPILWQHGKLKSNVRLKLLNTVNAFNKELKDLPKIKFKTALIVGTQARYNYTPHSDLDFHLKFVYPSTDSTQLKQISKLLKLRSQLWNKGANGKPFVSIQGIPVETYTELNTKPGDKRGQYDVLKNRWITKAQRFSGVIPIAKSITLAKQYNQQITTLIHTYKANKNTFNCKRLKSLRYQIKKMRDGVFAQNNPATNYGDFSAENISYKALRNLGVLNQLKYTYRACVLSRAISLSKQTFILSKSLTAKINTAIMQAKNNAFQLSMPMLAASLNSNSKLFLSVSKHYMQLLSIDKDLNVTALAHHLRLNAIKHESSVMYNVWLLGRLLLASNNQPLFSKYAKVLAQVELRMLQQNKHPSTEDMVFHAWSWAYLEAYYAEQQPLKYQRYKQTMLSAANALPQNSNQYIWAQVLAAYAASLAHDKTSYQLLIQNMQLKGSIAKYMQALSANDYRSWAQAMLLAAAAAMQDAPTFIALYKPVIISIQKANTSTAPAILILLYYQQAELAMQQSI